MDKRRAIAELRDCDHDILTPTRARQLAKPFGAKAPVGMFRLGEDKVVELRGGQARGVDAAALAEAIAEHLGCVYDVPLGRGKRLMRACNAIEAWLDRHEGRVAG